MLARTDRANTCSAGRVLVNSRFAQDMVNRIYSIESRVSYHGVDVDWARPDDGEREPFVLSVGSLTPLKGFDFLIHALAEVTIDRRPPLVLVSNFQNPPERAFLQSLAQELNVALILRCNISDSELADLYRRARVVAYAPVREPFGLVALEAMASATPVVAVAEGGVAESVVHEHTGLLTARDPVEFATALLRVFGNRRLAEQLGRNGRDHVLRYWTWDQAATTLEQHLQGVIVQAGRKQTIQKPYPAERIT
jgi:glycosyltransferase involved in cell wall biosynthesis